MWSFLALVAALLLQLVFANVIQRQGEQHLYSRYDYVV